LRAAVWYADTPHLRIDSLGRTLDIGTDEARMSAERELSRAFRRLPHEAVVGAVEELKTSMSADRWLELNAKFNSDEPMDWADVARVHSMGAEIGSHCHEHVLLHDGQSAETVEFQLQQSKQSIELHLGRCKYLAYPSGGAGDVSPFALGVAKKNFDMCFSSIGGEITKRADAHLLPRINCHNDLSLFKFNVDTAFRHNGAYARHLSGLHPVLKIRVKPGTLQSPED
jgi:hypothetical protein